MHKQVVTRFAPSPTGFLHLGGARTALYNYLYARQHQGILRLRIEDTDIKRSSQEMTRQIFEGLRWLGIEWQGEVVYQGANAVHHRRQAEILIEKGHAYRCFCSTATLDSKRREAEAKKQEYKYDGTCRHLTPEQVQKNLDAGTPFAIRFKVPGGDTGWDDGVHGNITVRNNQLDDFIIVRSNNSPVYHLAVVVDDHTMEVTHVIRGDDHISNTPKQLLLYRALGWEPPRFTHVPLILGPDKKRLSKRHGTTAVEEYRRMGYLPEALFNFLAILGWTPHDEKEIMSRKEILENFTLDGISRKNAVFDEHKLLWLNAQYIMQKSPQALLNEVGRRWQEAGFIQETDFRNGGHWLVGIIKQLQPRCKVLTDFVEQGRFYFQEPEAYDERGICKYLKYPGVWELLEAVQTRLQHLETFHQEQIEKEVRQVAARANLSAARIIHPLRLALTGKSASPGLFEVMETLGRQNVIDRIQLFLDKKEMMQQTLHKQGE